MRRPATKLRDQNGAIGMLSVILLTTLALVFTLTISLQILINVKNVKLTNDFEAIYYATEGGLRDARMQAKKEQLSSQTFQDLNVGDVMVMRSLSMSLTNATVTATGTTSFIKRELSSPCATTISGCTTAETIP